MVYADKHSRKGVTRPGGLVENHGGNAEQGALQNDRARFRNSQRGLRQRPFQPADLNFQMNRTGTGPVSDSLQLFVRPDDFETGFRFRAPDSFSRVQQHRQMTSHLGSATARQKQYQWRSCRNLRLTVFDSRLLKSVNHRMPDKFHAHLWLARRVPFLLEWKNAEQQVAVAGELMGAAGARSPDLWRHVLDDSRIPVVERTASGADMLFNGMRKAAVEPREINANDHVRLAFKRELKE